MTELNVTLGIEGYALDKFVQSIEEKLDLLDKIEEEVADKFDTIFEDTLDDKLSQKITEEVNNVVSDIIDDRIESKVGSEVEHYMQYEFDMNMAVQDAINDSDVNDKIADQIDDLLRTYNPGVTCSVGDKFTKAVAKAIDFIFEEQDEQTNRLALLIKDAIEHAISYEIVQKMKEDIIKEHNANLSEYFKNVATSSQITQNNPYTITNLNTTYNQ